MQSIKFQNGGVNNVRLANRDGHVCTIDAGEEFEVPGVLVAEALAANLICLEKDKLPSADELVAKPKAKAKAKAAPKADGDGSTALLVDQE